VYAVQYNKNRKINVFETYQQGTPLGQHYRTFLEQNKLVRLTRQNIDVQGPALLDNNGLNALAYHKIVKVPLQKSFIDLTPGASKLAPMTA
jgi:hypothetical protein